MKEEREAKSTHVLWLRSQSLMPLIGFNWSQGPKLWSVMTEDRRGGHRCSDGQAVPAVYKPQPILGGSCGSHHTALPASVTGDLSSTLGDECFSFGSAPCLFSSSSLTVMLQVFGKHAFK